jgi:hypothetical protein
MPLTYALMSIIVSGFLRRVPMTDINALFRDQTPEVPGGFWRWMTIND